MSLIDTRTAGRLNTTLYPVLLAAILLLIAASPAGAAGDPEAGAAKAATCAACHGADGNSVNPQWPSLAGQHAGYLADTLRAFKEGKRSDVLMNAQVMALSDEDIEDLAAYYAQQVAVTRTADPELAAAGERLYRGGDKKSDIAACIACHGPAGRGNAPAGYPAVYGQHAAYTAKQLLDYQNGNRSSDGNTQIMRNVSSRLSQDQINAVAAYIQGLR